MKKLLENKVILVHVTAFAGPAACPPMEYAFGIPIPEFGYSYIEHKFYLPVTDGKSYLTYENTFVRYPIRRNGEYKDEEGVEARQYMDGDEVVTLRWMKQSPANIITSFNSSRGDFVIDYGIGGVEDDPISRIVVPPPGSRIIDSKRIPSGPSDKIHYATHFIYCKIIPVRNIVNLFKTKMMEESHEEELPICLDETACICNGSGLTEWGEECDTCQYLIAKENLRLKKHELTSNIINLHMRRSIIYDMYFSKEYRHRWTMQDDEYSVLLNKSARLRYWYWRMTSCTDEELFSPAGRHGYGYVDNYGVSSLDELLWKMDMKEDLKAFIRLRKSFREAKKSKDTLVVEFLECNAKCVERLEQWWLLYMGVESPEDIVPHGLHSVTQAMGYDMYEEARILLTRFDQSRLGDAEAIRQYSDLCSRLGVDAGVFSSK